MAKNKTYIKFRKRSNIADLRKTATIADKADFTRDGTYMDPMNDIMSLYNTIDVKSNLDLYFTYVFKRRKNVFEYTRQFLQRVRSMKKKSDEDLGDEPKITKSEKPNLELSIGFKITSKDPYMIESTKVNIRSAFSPFISNGKVRFRNREKFMPMTYGQVVNFFHIPTVENFYKGMEYCLYKKLPYPTNLPTVRNTKKEDLTILGNTDYRWDKVTFGIRKDDKFRHMYIVGKTWTGKSTFIANMIKSDMQAGNWVCLLDPHGELVDTVLEHIPNNRINDVILFDVADGDWPIGFNLLQADTDEWKNLIVSGVVGTFKKLFGDSRGPRLEYILRNVALSVVDYPNATLMHILRVLVDKNFREEVISHIKDAVVVKFRRWEFDTWKDKQREEAISPITNKVGQFLSSKLVRNIFGQPRTKLNLRKAMDEGKIILVNLSKGKIWEDNANMIWSLLVTKFQIDAMSRADIPMHDRRDFYLYIDEFQNFATTWSFATILSEARKYKLSLIVVNQYIAQLPIEIKDAIFGNVGTIMSFTLGSDDASVMSTQFKEMVTVNDLISLPKFTAYTRLMVDGISSDPFSMKTINISTPQWSLELIDKIRKQSRQRYAMSKAQLEKLLAARSTKTFSIQEKVAEKAKMEALWISSTESENMQNQFVQDRMHFFTEYAVDEVEPDAIIFDTSNQGHKAVWYTKPKGLDVQADLKFKKGQMVSVAKWEIPANVEIYQHQTISMENKAPLMIWIGTREDAMKQLQDIFDNAGISEDHRWVIKFCPNIKKLESQNAEQVKKAQADAIANLPPEASKWWGKYAPRPNIPAPVPGFSIKDIKLWEEYEWYVKLSYNYGMFVTVKGVEWLLHKNFIVAPEGVEWKKYYNIGDKIKVRAIEFKDVNGEQKVVRSQKKK